jgi:pimeloyl-ACP methyl ester carboxylesterase
VGAWNRGGADQGPATAQSYLGEGFRVIAISRFGYLGSPLPKDGSPAAQADLYTSLLDELGIQQVALVGTSAGTASSLQFALRYPERCAALVLWSMAVPPYGVPSQPLRFALRTFFGSDFLLWAVITYFPGIMRQIMGVPRSIQQQLVPEQISVPKLIIHAVDDPMPPFAGAKAIAGALTNTRFIEIKYGGHLLLGHFEQVRAAVAAFIRQYAGEQITFL